MDVNRPDAAKDDQAGQRLEREAEEKRRQIDQRQRVDRVDGMLAMGGQPVEMFRAVMDRVKSPQPADAMLQAMAPIMHRSLRNTTSIAWSHQLCDATVAESPLALAVEPAPSTRAKRSARSTAGTGRRRNRNRSTRRAGRTLTALRGKGELQRTEHEAQEDEAQAARQEQFGHIHGCGSARSRGSARRNLIDREDDGRFRARDQDGTLVTGSASS